MGRSGKGGRGDRDTDEEPVSRGHWTDDLRDMSQASLVKPADDVFAASSGPETRALR